MKKLFTAADTCIAEMNWRDLALVKFCLCSMGILLGLAAPKRSRKWVALGAGVLFIATYIPLMLKFLPHLGRARSGGEE
ncbi:MAG TPA: permease of phosphate ABC transporter [Candidatus Flavonifractor merdigallinarum]|uniref:Permease of phosphate ABC transporter n=1 Tax=Candidatus Flavonifractor merdigallinarum TaxID=2838589 RepID=A0A9D2BXP7_9FIRM|nr:permease of phosphate ABC transporter [Candidatus Flavonifractor merdigallinarum]